MFELWLDAETGRIARIIEEGAVRTSTTILSDYRKVEGLWLPFRVVSSTGEPNSEVVTLVREILVDPENADGAFDVPAASVADFTMPADTTSVTLPFELLNNHIYVMASVNGGQTRRFLVDTGGVNLLTRQAAADMGVATEGSFPVGGAGEKSIQGSFAQLDSFSLAGIVFPEPRFLVIPFEEVERAEGVEMDGLVGFEVFRRFVVTIDYGAGLLTLTLPAAFEIPADAVAVPFAYDGRHPVVQGSIDGIPGSFTIDTGSRSTLDLHGPFVDEHDLMAAYRPQLSALTGWGVGGGVRSHVARADMLMLGHVPVPDVTVELTAQQRGAFSDHYQAGNVGGGVLKRFTVTFHYPRQEILFQPGPLADVPEGFDRSGMWLNDAGDVLQVEDVVTDGPAAGAGIEVGDQVEAVDGMPVAEVSLPSLRQRLRNEPPGTVIVLTLRRDGERRHARVVLRDLL
jgi:hypothetical protein